MELLGYVCGVYTPTPHFLQPLPGIHAATWDGIWGELGNGEGEEEFELELWAAIWLSSAAIVLSTF